MLMTLVKPPERSRLNFGTFSLAVLAAAVRDIAKVKILDATDLTIDEAVKAVIRSKPDLVGVTTMALASVEPVGAFLEALREAGYEGLLIAGGHGASMLPRTLIEKGADAVVYGEGEQTLRELLLSGISENLPGLFLLRDGGLLRTSPRPLLHLDKLPEPARDLAYLPKDGIAMLETSRGCPHSCAFCEATRFHRGVWRARSPELVAKDVRHLVNRHGAIVIHIADDNFMASPERALRICERLSGGPLPLFFLFSARSDDLLWSPDLIPSLARVNFLYATVGVETVEPELAKCIRKEIPFRRHKQAFTAMRDVGIYTVASFIIGLPHETEEMRRSYIEAAAELADAAHFLPFQPLPGTPMGNHAGEPEPWCVNCAVKMKREFERHPIVLRRLLDAAKKNTARGLLARASLRRRLKENILGEREANTIAKELVDEEEATDCALRAIPSQGLNNWKRQVEISKVSDLSK